MQKLNSGALNRILLFVYILSLSTNAIAQNKNNSKETYLLPPHGNYVYGRVIEKLSKEPMVGVTIRLDGHSTGVITDINGCYVLTLPEKGGLVIYSYIGFETRKIKVTSRQKVDVQMVEATESIQEVIVTGYNSIQKESFTGNTTKIEKEDLLKVNPNNLISAIQTFDPSFRIQENLAAGSDPNSLPQFVLRGQTGIGETTLGQTFTSSISREVLSGNSNLPIFILDGFEVDVEKIYDLDMNSIHSINILKDAAATAIYGSRGSNGVIVVTTKQPEAGKLRVNAEIGIDIEAPDLTSYDLLNAAEKLQLEWDLGLYKNESLPSNDVWYKEAYAKRKRAIASGTDTDWLSKPLHTGVGSHYNLRMEGGSDEFRWSASVGYKNTQGAMRDSERKSLNTSLTLMYKVKNFTFKNQASYGTTKSKESKYGTFSDYVKQQPYNAPYDENGKLVRMFDGFHAHYQGYQNPLYDATLNSFDKSSYRTLTDNFAIEWNPFEGLTLRGQVGITATDNTSDRFLPAEHSTFTDDSQYETDEGFLRR